MKSPSLLFCLSLKQIDNRWIDAMPQTVFTSCPLDCFDQCRFKVTVRDNQVLNIAADEDHPVTQGLICRKGKNLVQRFAHPDRIRQPLIQKHLLGKAGHGFEPAGYDQVFDIVSGHLTKIKQQYGPTAVMDYSGSGYGGLKGRIQSIFFNQYGGATRPAGSLCWGAGIMAQRYDFGNCRGHHPDDLLNANLIIIWGRNPRYTNLHLYTRLKQAEKQGSRVLVIDPVKTATARGVGEYIRINPATDAALALAMARIIIENHLYDEAFISKHVIGFKRFKASLAGYTPEKAEEITGIPARTIHDLAMKYATTSRSSIIMGYGMQRYSNGGNAIRAIDALGAVAGKIGRKGCGVNYCAGSLAPFLNVLEKESLSCANARRSFTISKLGDFLETVQDPPVKAVFVAGANPLNQSPNLSKAVARFSKIDFKVVFDHFMTDTARHADIVLPGASVFEQEDIFVTSMYSPVLNYSHKAIDPPAGILPEFEFYLELARKMGMNLGFNSSQEYLEKNAGPLLEKLDMDFDQIKSGYPRIKAHDIAFQDLQFETPSGKIEIYSEKASKAGLSALPAYRTPVFPPAGFPLRLLTCHSKESMHSQGFAFVDERPAAGVNEKTASAFDLRPDHDVMVRTKNGRLKAVLKIDNSICDQAVFVFQGFWHKSGAVNFLTEDGVSDMGRQAAFYDTFCTLEKVPDLQKTA